MNQIASMEQLAETPERCVIVVDADLPPGKAANAAAVIALTFGQRHPGLVGDPLTDASGLAHPGLIPIGIAILAASQDELVTLRARGAAGGCDVVDFPLQGQQTTRYGDFLLAVAAEPTEALRYVAVGLVGRKKAVAKLVANLGLFK